MVTTQYFGSDKPVIKVSAWSSYPYPDVSKTGFKYSDFEFTAHA